GSYAYRETFRKTSHNPSTLHTMMKREKPHPPENFINLRQCGARTRRGTACRAPAMRNGRCRLHGGKSTGQRTAAGRERIRQAVTIHGRYSRGPAWDGPDDPIEREIWATHGHQCRQEEWEQAKRCGIVDRWVQELRMKRDHARIAEERA